MGSYTQIPFSKLKLLLSKKGDYESDLEFKNRIVKDSPAEVQYFLNEYSRPFVTKIAFDLFHYSFEDFLSYYYVFISSDNYKVYSLNDFPKENDYKRTWKRIALYTGYSTNVKKHNGRSKLYTYVRKITKQYFVHVLEKDKKTQVPTCEGDLFDMLDSAIYRTLLQRDEEDNEAKALLMSIVKEAYNDLSEKDKMVIQYLVMEPRPSLQAFEYLKKYINPIGGQEELEQWDTKRIQDAMSLIKGRALSHLRKRVELIIKHK